MPTTPPYIPPTPPSTNRACKTLPETANCRDNGESQDLFLSVEFDQSPSPDIPIRAPCKQTNNFNKKDDDSNTTDHLLDRSESWVVMRENLPDNGDHELLTGKAIDEDDVAPFQSTHELHAKRSHNQDNEDEDEIVFLGEGRSRALTGGTRKDLSTFHLQSERNVDAHYVLSPCPSTARLFDEGQDDEPDVEFTGELRPAAKRRKISMYDVDASSEQGTPLREMEDSGTSGTRGRGSGSTVLSAAVRGNILQLLLNQGSLLSLTKGHNIGGIHISSWADIAEAVGAEGRDFDRVRHTAKWFQNNLAAMMRRGAL